MNKEAILVKKAEGWYNLYEGKIGIGSTFEELQPNKLSTRNCQEIEIGIDLEKQASEYAEKRKQISSVYASGLYYGFNEGFQQTFQLIEKYLPKQDEWKVTFNLDELDSEGCLILKRI